MNFYPIVNIHLLYFVYGVCAEYNPNVRVKAAARQGRRPAANGLAAARIGCGCGAYFLAFSIDVYLVLDILPYKFIEFTPQEIPWTP